MYVLALCINRPAFMYAITFARQRAVIEIILANISTSIPTDSVLLRWRVHLNDYSKTDTVVASHVSSLREFWSAKIRQRENNLKVDLLILQWGVDAARGCAGVRSEGGKAENRESENGRGVGWFQNDLAESNWTAQNWRWFKLAALSTCRLTHLRQHNHE